jgi:ABC-2 type transport system ATP-binding protein
MITLKNITKKFGRTLAVDGINLSVARGEIFGFIGPNGAGKTTTIRIMGGILAPTEGAVIIDGVDMAREPEKAKRKIGFIPDRPFLYEKLTGMEFMRFSADLYGVKDGIFREKAETLLKMFSLKDWAHGLVESYSHGMKQRLIIAAALLHEPTVIIVDEPMVGLDPTGIIMVKELLRSKAREGSAVFMSTHSLGVAEDICDRIGVIHRGAMIATGTTNDLRRTAGVGEADLEAVFLKLTAESDSP